MPKTKKSMLAWWGIIPAALFILIEVTFGWPAAKLNATSPDFAVSYLVGQAMGGLLIALVVAWVPYRLLSRSQLAGTITFSIIICLAGLACFGSLLKAKARDSLNRASTLSSAIPLLASFGAFQFEIPPGWISVPPDRPKTQAMIVLIGKGEKEPGAMLMVDAGKPAFPNSREMAQSFAGKDGRVLPEPILLDGNEAIQVETPSTDLSRPRFVAIVFRDGKAYLVMAAATKGADVSGAFKHILKTWRWNKMP